MDHGLPKDMIEEAKKLKKGKVTFRRNQEILLISHQDKRLVNMISTLHTAEVTKQQADEQVWHSRPVSGLLPIHS